MFKLAISLILFLSHSFIFANEGNEIDELDTPSETDPDIGGLKALVPSEQMAHEAKWLIHALEKAHFNKISALDVNATIFLERFLRNLDRQKLFFSKQDLKKYNDRYSSTLITYLSQGNLFPAFEIYSDYRKKAITRLSQVSEAKLVSLDLKSDQTYTPQRQDLEWDEDDMKLNKTWIKLLTHELITESLVSSDINASEPLLEKDKTETLATAREEISKKYARWKKNILEFEPSDIQELYLSTLTQMFDPHTSFLNVKEKEKFDQNMHNEFVGIGAVLTDNDGYCTIKELLPGGPAEASRALEPEDVILKVAQGESEFVNVVNMKLSKIVELIKGPENTLVRLEIRSIKDKSITKKVRIIREKIKLTANLASASIHLADFNNTETKIGVINLPSFYGSSGDGPKATEDVDQLITKLKKDQVEGIILDLRRNGGGYLSEAVNLAGLFISRGPIVQVKSVDGKIRKKFDFNPKLSWNKPLIILTSRYSASASEIVAGALKDLNRAIIVGDSATHGKGTVQSLLPMNIPILSNLDHKKRSAAKITIQKYYLPSGNSTQIKGVESDISLPSINELLPIGESDLDNALSWDQISSVNYKRPDGEFYLHADAIDNLLSLSLTRQTKNPEFQYLRDSIELFMKRKEQTDYSLNYSDRLNEIVSDRNASSVLDTKFEALEDLSFESKSIYLDIVNKQKEKSRAITGSKEDSNLNIFTMPESLDIKLHESIRIMTDWLRMLDMEQSQANLQKAEAERKEKEAEQQRALTVSKLEKDFPRVKELGDSMKDKTFVFKSIYLGMPVWDAKSALLATGIGDVQENDNNQTFIKNKIVLEDRTVSHDVISSLKSVEPSPPFGASDRKKLEIKTEYTLSMIMACNGVSKRGLFSDGCPPSDGKIDVIDIYEDGLKALFNFDDDIDLSTLVKIVSEVYNLDFVRYSNMIMTAYIHVDYDKGYVLRLMSNVDGLSFKLLKIPSVSEIKMAKQAAEEATRKKIENARAAFD